MLEPLLLALAQAAASEPPPRTRFLAGSFVDRVGGGTGGRVFYVGVVVGTGGG